MIQPITLLGALLCFWVLYLKYRSQPKNRPRRSAKQRFGTVKLLFAAFVAWMALSFTLQHMLAKLDGPITPEPSLLERFITLVK